MLRHLVIERTGSTDKSAGVRASRTEWLLGGVLFLCIARLWLFSLPSSFWVDEMGTAFVVQRGAGDPSFRAAPQVPMSIYYALPKTAQSVFGFSETAYRIPSVICMGLALLLIAAIAGRTIHPDAGWFAVFACLLLRECNYQAADADSLAGWRAVAGCAGVRGNGLAAVAGASFVLAVYLVFAIYALVRLARRTCSAGWAQAAGISVVVGVSCLCWDRRWPLGAKPARTWWRPFPRPAI